MVTVVPETIVRPGVTTTLLVSRRVLGDDLDGTAGGLDVLGQRDPALARRRRAVKNTPVGAVMPLGSSQPVVGKSLTQPISIGPVLRMKTLEVVERPCSRPELVSSQLVAVPMLSRANSQTLPEATLSPSP